LYNCGESSELNRHIRDVRFLAGDGQMHRHCQEGTLLCMAGRLGRMVVRSDFHRQNELRESAIHPQHRHEGDHRKKGKERSRVLTIRFLLCFSSRRFQIKLWIFPEGTRHNTGEIHPFKKGAFHAAIRSQLPILPVVFSSYYFLSAKEKRFDSGE